MPLLPELLVQSWLAYLIPVFYRNRWIVLLVSFHGFVDQQIVAGNFLPISFGNGQLLSAFRALSFITRLCTSISQVAELTVECILWPLLLSDSQREVFSIFFLFLKLILFPNLAPVKMPVKTLSLTTLHFFCWHNCVCLELAYWLNSKVAWDFWTI